MSATRVLLAGMTLGALAACGPDWRLKVPPKYLEVAEIQHAYCGNCHRRIDPGQRTRAQLERALVRHRSRVKMTEAQWALLVDYLSETP